MKITKEIKKQAIKPFFNDYGIYDVSDIKVKTKGHFFSEDVTICPICQTVIAEDSEGYCPDCLTPLEN